MLAGLVGAVLVTSGWMFRQTSSNCGDPAITQCTRLTPAEEAEWDNIVNDIDWQPDDVCSTVENWVSDWGGHEVRPGSWTELTP